MKSVSRIMRSLGENVRVVQGGKTANVKAVIQPMNRKWISFLSGERVPSGILNNNHYLMLAAPELDVDDNNEVKVDSADKSYYIRYHGDFKVKGKKIYVWAVLSARTEALEDDYD